VFAEATVIKSPLLQVVADSPDGTRSGEADPDAKKRLQESGGRRFSALEGPACSNSQVATLPRSACELVESGALAHLVTLNRDGSPQVSCVWMGIEGDELVAGHLPEHQKIRNIRRDSRVVVSFEGTRIRSPGLKEYLVVHGRAHVTEGGAPELLQRLAHVYLGPDVKFPPMPDPPPGFVTHIAVERIGGVGPWAA
jgi:PPOX class probable F420-dependent enzyme